MTDSFTSLCTDVGFVVLYFAAMGVIFSAIKAVLEAWERRRGPQEKALSARTTALIEEVARVRAERQRSTIED
jgi:hypothetical protein